MVHGSRMSTYRHPSFKLRIALRKQPAVLDSSLPVFPQDTIQSCLRSGNKFDSHTTPFFLQGFGFEEAYLCDMCNVKSFLRVCLSVTKGDRHRRFRSGLSFLDLEIPKSKPGLPRPKPTAAGHGEHGRFERVPKLYLGGKPAIPSQAPSSPVPSSQSAGRPRLPSFAADRATDRQDGKARSIAFRAPRALVRAVRQAAAGCPTDR